MKRETRTNVIFLVVLLALTLPGAVMMFVRKLQPNQRMNYEPQGIRLTEAYNNPQTATSSAIRQFPPKTLAWTAASYAAESGRPPLRYVAAGGREQPVISQGRRFELLGYAPPAGGGPATLDVLFWSNDFAAGDAAITGRASFADAAAARPVASATARTLVVPEAVVQELLDEGFSKPPRRVSLLRLTLGSPGGHGEGPAGLPRRVELAWRDGSADGAEVRDAVTLEPDLLNGSSGDLSRDLSGELSRDLSGDAPLPAGSADGTPATRPAG